ncbi:MAG TPA: alpha/beta fold hydrolase [Pseudolabrys sp.]|nr:alpha/beta fold hydrolase [Pseudolabrys sp.]
MSQSAYKVRVARPAMLGSPWLHRMMAREDVALRLFCFPYAGAAASAFRLWPSGLADGIDVCAIQLPGRANRLQEPPLSSIGAMVDAVVDAMADYLDRPFALFGHSMGGLLAFEVAHALAARGWKAPRHLIVSARRAPRVPDPSSLLHVLPDAEFVAEIQRRYGGIPDEILAHADVLALLLPCLRADITALETYRPPQRPPLHCPLTVFGGAEDRFVSPMDIAQWRRETTGTFDMRIFPGGHFYLDAQRTEVLADVSARLATVTAVVPPQERVT